jgi:hypothetical protein
LGVRVTVTEAETGPVLRSPRAYLHAHPSPVTTVLLVVSRPAGHRHFVEPLICGRGTALVATAKVRGAETPRVG